MLDAGQGANSGCPDTFPMEPEKGARRQYTVKGIENETVELMRDAAKKEGMKISAWISHRMREAAEKSLADQPQSETEALSDSVSAKADPLIRQLVELINSYREVTEYRMLSIERELHEITSSQRTIMTNLLSRK